MLKAKNICYDSRKVTDGSVFVCISGEQSDGHDYIDAAVKAGAHTVYVEKNKANIAELKNKFPQTDFQETEDSRATLAQLAAEFYGYPAQQINLIGVTGTNGKTTVTHLIQKLLDSCALLGTMGLKETAEDDYLDMGNTTPQSAEIHKILAEIKNKKIKNLTMEVSSHALEQKRCAEMQFKTSIVTNLSQDHLDYHLTMEKYFQAKAKIFLQTSDYAVLNADDEYFEKFKSAASNLKVLTFAINNPADLQAKNLAFSDHGLAFDLYISPQSALRTIAPELAETSSFALKLNGLFNVYNALAAIMVAILEKVELSTIKDRIENIDPINGRFDTVKEANSPLCVIDYAHSPDGLENVLLAARELLKLQNKQAAQLICVFGCGGDRDITKRPKMAKIAEEIADFSYVTSDNPRSEDPEQIIADILSGISDMSKVKVEPDRALAIREAVSSAKAEDIVVVAGKGHEDYQILADRTIHFDDREHVLAAIRLSD